MDGSKRELGLPNGLGVFSYEGGGIALLWTHEIYVKLQSYDKLHINMVIVDQISSAEQWRFSGFYGEARRERRHRSWELLHFLSNQTLAHGFVLGISMRYWIPGSSLGV